MIPVLVEVGQALVGTKVQPSGDFVIAFEGADPSKSHSHFQVYDDGVLTRWELGRPESLNGFRLVQEESVQVDMLTQRHFGNALLAATRVSPLQYSRQDTPPPLDEARVDWANLLPAIPTVGVLVVNCVLTASPWGRISWFHQFLQGQLVSAGLGEHRDPDVIVERRFDYWWQERMGQIDFQESLFNGALTGHPGKLMLYFGICQSPEYKVCRGGLMSEYGPPLVALGSLTSSPHWRNAVVPALTRMPSTSERPM